LCKPIQLKQLHSASTLNCRIQDKTHFCVAGPSLSVVPCRIDESLTRDDTVRDRKSAEKSTDLKQETTVREHRVAANTPYMHDYTTSTS